MGYGTGTISIFQINPSLGTLTVVGTVPVPESDTSSLTVTPDGKNLFALSEPGDSMSSYTLDPKTGMLGGASIVLAGTGGRPRSVIMDLSGAFIFVANHLLLPGAGTVSGFNIRSGMAKIAGSPFAAGTSPIVITLDPSGQFVYAVNNESNNVFVYALNRATGTLSAGGTFSTGKFPTSVAVTGTIQ